MAHPVGEGRALKEIGFFKSKIRIFGINRADILSGSGENKVGIFFDQTDRPMERPGRAGTEDINIFLIPSYRIPVGTF